MKGGRRQFAAIDDDVTNERNFYGNSGSKLLLKRISIPYLSLSGICVGVWTRGNEQGSDGRATMGTVTLLVLALAFTSATVASEYMSYS